MSGGYACHCRPRQVMVTDDHCNHSAFNGYRFAPSDYSEVVCLICGARWRTKGEYVERSPRAPKDWFRVHDPAKWREMIASREAARTKRAEAAG